MSHWEELRTRIAGTIVPMTTPFTDSGEVDLNGVRENTRFLIESGIKVISPLGSTGEFYTMTQEEHWAVLKTVCEEAKGRATIIAGAGHSGTKIASHLAGMAHEAGADATLVCVPYYKYDGAEGVYQHYRAIARENPKIGMVVYANREIMKDLSILERLTTEPNIVGVKDATGDYALYRDECIRFRGRLAIVGGGSMQHYLWGQLWGSPGYFSSVANFKPEVELGFVTYLKEGNLKAATTIVEKIELPFFEIAIKLGWWRTLKATMDIYGLPGGNSRLPNRRLTPVEKEELVTLLRKIDLMP
jgi:dihydrodipicolinate synthase/N-acetylneuraminate lyase